MQMNAGLFCCCSGLGHCGTGQLVGTALGGCAAPPAHWQGTDGHSWPSSCCRGTKSFYYLFPPLAGSACLAQSSAMQPAGLGSACQGSTRSAAPVGTGQGIGFKVKEGAFGLDVKGKEVRPQHCCPEPWVPHPGGARGHRWAVGSLSWGQAPMAGELEPNGSWRCCPTEAIL